MPIKSIIVNNLDLKIVALIMALLLWFYVAAEQGNIELKNFIDQPVKSESVEL